MGRTPRLATALVAAAVLAVAGCGGGSSAAAPATAAPTTSHEMAGMTTGDHSMDMAPTKAATNAGFGDCAQHMPGDDGWHETRSLQILTEGREGR